MYRFSLKLIQPNVLRFDESHHFTTYSPGIWVIETSGCEFIILVIL